MPVLKIIGTYTYGCAFCMGSFRLGEFEQTLDDMHIDLGLVQLVLVYM